MVIIYTSAYNAEKTLKRTICSVLSQTYTDFLYYILENASIDSTESIIDDFALRDSRIHKLKNVVNNPVEIFNLLPHTFFNVLGASFFVNLDADDEFKPDFLEKTLAFMQQDNLDIAVCGSDFIDTKTKCLISQRGIDQNLIVQDKYFCLDFPQYHQFMRTVWGKVFSLDLLRKCYYDNVPDVAYGIDTLFTMEAFRHAKRVGILSGTLHKYYVSQKSVSYRFNEKRIYSDQILAAETERYLLDKCGVVSQRNQEFLRYVYLNALKDTINVLLSSKEMASSKLRALMIILQNNYTQDLLAWNSGGKQKENLVFTIVRWVLAQKEIYTTEVTTATKILALIGTFPNKISNLYTTEQKFRFLSELRNQWNEKTIPKALEVQLATLLDTSVLLKQHNIAFCCYFNDICTAILREDLISAVQNIQVILSAEQEIPEEYVLSLLSLAVNLTAKLEDMELFVYFKKIYISLLLDFGKLKLAQEELADWDIILPDDLDFKELREKINYERD